MMNLKKNNVVRNVVVSLIAVMCFGLIGSTFAQGPYTKTAIEAGPIWDQADAEYKCPIVAVEHGAPWNGQWWTTIPNQMSVCELNVPDYTNTSPVNGYNVTNVKFTDSYGKILGNFHLSTNNTWVEDSTTEQNRFTFSERNRDEWSVYLYDASRDMHIQLDLYTKEVKWNGNKLYTIMESNAVNGYSANRVNFSDGYGTLLGDFHKNADGTWSEDSITEMKRYRFTERSRDEWSVYLYDASRNMNIQLDLHTKEVKWDGSKLYTVMSSSW